MAIIPVSGINFKKYSHFSKNNKIQESKRIEPKSQTSKLSCFSYPVNFRGNGSYLGGIDREIRECQTMLDEIIGLWKQAEEPPLKVFFDDIDYYIENNLLKVEMNDIPQETWDGVKAIFFPVDNKELTRLTDEGWMKFTGEEVKSPEYPIYRERLEKASNLYYNNLASLNLRKSSELENYLRYYTGADCGKTTSKFVGYTDTIIHESISTLWSSDDLCTCKTIAEIAPNGSYSRILTLEMPDESDMLFAEPISTSQYGTVFHIGSIQNKIKKDKPLKYVEFGDDGTMKKLAEYNNGKLFRELIFPDENASVISKQYNADGSLAYERLFHYKNGELILSNQK